MFVCVARLTLEIPAAGSLKAKRQVLRRVTDRVKAKFNVAVAEVEDNDVWNRAVIALAVVGNERRHVNEQMDKILQFIDDMYVAPVVSTASSRSSPSGRTSSFAGRARTSSARSPFPRASARWPRPRVWGRGRTRHERQAAAALAVGSAASQGHGRQADEAVAGGRQGPSAKAAQPARVGERLTARCAGQRSEK